MEKGILVGMLGALLVAVFNYYFFIKMFPPKKSLEHKVLFIMLMIILFSVFYYFGLPLLRSQDHNSLIAFILIGLSFLVSFFKFCLIPLNEEQIRRGKYF